MTTSVGVIRERSELDHRVALVPDSVSRLVSVGFDILVERGA
jgi:alanine dehydrogenase